MDKVIKATKEEQPKTAETMEEVDNVSESELKDVEAHLKAQNESTTSGIIKEALKDQSGLRTLAEIIHDLSQPLPTRHLKKLMQGGARGSTYIPWPIAVKYLDFYAPGWENTLEVVNSEYGSTVITALIVPTSDFGKVTRSDVGFEPHVTNKGKENEKLTGFGGSSPIAARQSLKRAAALGYGLGRYLYEK
jgi:hypothetical protein